MFTVRTIFSPKTLRISTVPPLRISTVRPCERSFLPRSCGSPKKLRISMMVQRGLHNKNNPTNNFATKMDDDSIDFGSVYGEMLCRSPGFSHIDSSSLWDHPMVMMGSLSTTPRTTLRLNWAAPLYFLPYIRRDIGPRPRIFPIIVEPSWGHPGLVLI